jgi:multidrug transporter EmrE-like cation transporter
MIQERDMSSVRIERVGTLFGLWVLFLTVECTAQIGLKLGSGALENMPFGALWIETALSQGWVQIGIACYVLAFVFWMLILDRMDLSLAFPLSGTVYVVVLLASALGLHETLTPLHWAGVGLIMSGVWVMGQD